MGSFCKNRDQYELIMIGLSALFGATLGLSFNVFVLIPAVIVAVLSAGLVELARGDQGGFVILTIVFVVTAIQIGYLIGSIAAAAIESLGTLGRKTGVVLNIHQHMEVVGSDGESLTIQRVPTELCYQATITKLVASLTSFRLIGLIT
jgi:hypothetical protein